MLAEEQQARYAAWLKERYPLTHRHYFSFVRSLIRSVGEQPDAAAIVRWIESYRGQSRRAARKGLRRLMRWAQSEGVTIPSIEMLTIPAPRKTLSASAAARLIKKERGTLKERQIFVMTSLFLKTELPASAIGQLRSEHMQVHETGINVVWRNKVISLNADAEQILQGWLRLRERLRTLPEERRRHRKTDAWAESEFLFPNAHGGASGHGVIWRSQAASQEGES